MGLRSFFVSYKLLSTSITTGDILRSLTFASNSVPCAWDLKGALSTHITEPIIACDRNEGLFVCSHEGTLVLTRVPAPLFTPGTVGVPVGQRHLIAHSGALSSMVFIEEGSKLVTAGGADGVIIVWKVTYDTEEGDPAMIKTLPNLVKPGEGEEEEGEEAPVEEEEEAPEEEEEEDELDDVSV